MATYIVVAYKMGCLSGSQYVVCVRDTKKEALKEAKIQTFGIAGTYGIAVYSVHETLREDVATSDWRALRVLYSALLQGDGRVRLVDYFPSRRGEEMPDFLDCDEA